MHSWWQEANSIKTQLQINRHLIYHLIWKMIQYIPTVCGFHLVPAVGSWPFPQCRSEPERPLTTVVSLNPQPSSPAPQINAQSNESTDWNMCRVCAKYISCPACKLKKSAYIYSWCDTYLQCLNPFVVTAVHRKEKRLFGHQLTAAKKEGGAIKWLFDRNHMQGHLREHRLPLSLLRQ